MENHTTRYITLLRSAALGLAAVLVFALSFTLTRNIAASNRPDLRFLSNPAADAFAPNTCGSKYSSYSTTTSTSGTICTSCKGWVSEVELNTNTPASATAKANVTLDGYKSDQLTSDYGIGDQATSRLYVYHARFLTNLTYELGCQNAKTCIMTIRYCTE